MHYIQNQTHLDSRVARARHLRGDRRVTTRGRFISAAVRLPRWLPAAEWRSEGCAGNREKSWSVCVCVKNIILLVYCFYFFSPAFIYTDTTQNDWHLAHIHMYTQLLNIYTSTDTYTCVYTHVHIHMYTQLLNMYTSKDTYTCVYAHVHIHIHIHMYTQLLNMYTSTYTCVYTQVHTHIHLSTQTNTQRYDTNIQKCIHIYTHPYTQLYTTRHTTTQSTQLCNTHIHTHLSPANTRLSDTVL